MGAAMTSGMLLVWGIGLPVMRSTRLWYCGCKEAVAQVLGMHVQHTF